MNEIETITGVAIVTPDDKVWSLLKPNRHHNVIDLVFNKTGKQVFTKDQGFITNTGRYVNRKEALLIAIKAEQLLETSSVGDKLFSEDVW